MTTKRTGTGGENAVHAIRITDSNGGVRWTTNRGSSAKRGSAHRWPSRESAQAEADYFASRPNNAGFTFDVVDVG